VAEIVLEHVTKRFPGGAVAVSDLSLRIEDGAFVVLVGPSGSGKSTVLRLVAGLEEPTEGEIRIGGQVVNDLPPRERDLAMVFQNYALYPHLSAYDNMGFGLAVRHAPKTEIARRVGSRSRLLGIAGLVGRRPRELSGGERQRVAMGRAIVREPNAFLMDEPLSNLDAGMRVQMRTEIAELHRRLGTTTLYVTHDQVEAMTLGDEVALMREGRLEQVDTPRDLYEHPRTLFVAGFVGSPPMDLVRARLEARKGHVFADFAGGSLPVPEATMRERRGLEYYLRRELVLGIRPEDLEDASLVDDPDPEALLDVAVSVAARLGPEVLAHVQAGTATLTARLGPRSRARAGEPLALAVDTSRLHFFDPETEHAIS
jgi:multiple sugar transport system ATP-binding protein